LYLADAAERSVGERPRDSAGRSDGDDQRGGRAEPATATTATAAVAFIQRARQVGKRARRTAGVTGPGHGRPWYATLTPDMTDVPTRPPTDAPASAYDRRWLAEHLAEERRESSLLGEIREVVFGAQDGLVSTLAVVATVAGASGEAFPVVVAGVASGLAGVFSMAAGEYIGSKSQREIFDAQIHAERHEVEQRPGEAEAEVAYMLTEEGLDEDEAARIAAMMARHPEVLLRTMVARELGIQVEDRGGDVLRGALVPIVPFIVLPFGVALPIAAVATGAVLFGIGVVKSRWSHRAAIPSGLEVLALAAVAGVAGYLFGTLLPQLLGLAGITV
jgi:VIT1/CCC1 family predicted Fe2+/Mn2+ transporter